MRQCEVLGIDLDELSDAQLVEIHPMLTPEVRLVLRVDGAIAGRSRFGGTAPAAVSVQIAALKSETSRTRAWAESKLAASL